MTTSVRPVYGKSITLRYTPASYGEETTAYALVSARIYGPNQYPSDTQREDSAATAGGFVENVTSWTLVNDEGTGKPEYKVVFQPLVDPIPASRIVYDKYFVALNFRLESGGPIVSDIEQIFVYRIDGFTGKIRVTVDDVIAIEKKIGVLMKTSEIEKKIDLATDDIISRLEGRNYEKLRIYDWERLNLAASRLATAYCCYDQAGEGNQFWFAKGEKWEEKSDRMFDSAKVGYDIAGSDTPNADERVTTGCAPFTR